jgi:hypothetical protein
MVTPPRPNDNASHAAQRLLSRSVITCDNPSYFNRTTDTISYLLVRLGRKWRRIVPDYRETVKLFCYSSSHLILRNRPDLAAQWSDEEVVRRWWRLYPERTDDQGRPAEPTQLEINSILADPAKVAVYRQRLRSVSWFMKSLNEWFAKRANAEDGVRGHFWQERFRARNLLHEGAILACSIYIDLNEIRAELAATPEESQNTSAYRRILARILRRARAEAAGWDGGRTGADYRPDDPDYWMCPISEQDRAPLLGPAVEPQPSCEAPAATVAIESGAYPAIKPWRHGFLPVSVDEYLELLDWTGRQVVAGKRGVIDEAYPPILERLGLRASAWLEVIENFDIWFHGAVGQAEALAQHAARTGRHWIQGLRACRQAFT